MFHEGTPERIDAAESAFSRYLLGRRMSRFTQNGASSPNLAIFADRKFSRLYRYKLLQMRDDGPIA